MFSERKVAVLKLPMDVTEEEVRKLFEGYAVVSATVRKSRRENVKTRHAFVTFESHEEQEKALEKVNGAALREGVSVVVEAARIKKTRKNRKGRKGKKTTEKKEEVEEKKEEEKKEEEKKEEEKKEEEKKEEKKEEEKKEEEKKDEEKKEEKKEEEKKNDSA